MSNNSFSNSGFSAIPSADRDQHGLYTIAAPRGSSDIQQYATGASQDDAILVSSDDESDDDVLDWQSDTSLPSLHELGNPARYDSAESGTASSKGMYLNDLILLA